MALRKHMVRRDGAEYRYILAKEELSAAYHWDEEYVTKFHTRAEASDAAEKLMPSTLLNLSARVETRTGAVQMPWVVQQGDDTYKLVRQQRINV